MHETTPGPRFLAVVAIDRSLLESSLGAFGNCNIVQDIDAMLAGHASGSSFCGLERLFFAAPISLWETLLWGYPIIDLRTARHHYVSPIGGVQAFSVQTSH